MVMTKDYKTGGLVVAGSNPVTPTSANTAVAGFQDMKNIASLCKCCILAIVIYNYKTTTLDLCQQLIFSCFSVFCYKITTGIKNTRHSKNNYKTTTIFFKKIIFHRKFLKQLNLLSCPIGLRI